MMSTSGENSPAYLIELKDVQAKRKSVIGMLLSILAIIIFITRWETAKENYYLDIFNAFIILAGLIYNYINKKAEKNIPYRFFFFAAAVGLGLLYPFNILSIPYLLLAFTEGPLTGKQLVEFSSSGVIIKSWKKSQYEWDTIQSVVLKDGVLTLDFKNNYILQREIDSSVSINESAFNVWCAGCIHQAAFVD